MILIIATSKAPAISNFINVGIKSGGAEINPLKSIKPSNNPEIVIVKTPIIIAPVTFLIANTKINRKPMAASKVSTFLKLPMLKKVASFCTIIPPVFRPIKPTNKPTPAPMAILRFMGILLSIHCLNGVTLMITNKIPAKKTAPRATSHV